MSLRFKGGERLQRGRGIGGLLRLVKSLFTPLVKSAGKSIVKAATYNTGKAVIGGESSDIFVKNEKDKWVLLSKVNTTKCRRTGKVTLSTTFICAKQFI